MDKTTEKQAKPEHQARRSRPGKKKSRQEKARPQRCFFGLAFPLHTALADLQTDLQELAGSDGELRISPAANLHVTLKFLGSIEKQGLTEIELLARSICARYSPLTLQCQGIGMFKNSLWVGIRQDETLQEMAAQFDLAAQGVGIAREVKGYLPHVTVARFRPGERDRLKPLLEKYADRNWGQFECLQVHLYLSETLPEGARYSILHSFPLQNDSATDHKD
jgi:2'-5' RNA ligase